MAELETDCCAPTAQASCCEPEQKAECCGEHHGAGCGCPADADALTTGDALRETVREKYAAAARAAAAGSAGCCSPADETGTFGASLYGEEADAEIPEAAVGTSLGCVVPTAVADLHEGEIVLDLGSGAGADVLISARRVGPTGRAIGIDMTDEMLELARRNAAEAGIENAESERGTSSSCRSATRASTS